MSTTYDAKERAKDFRKFDHGKPRVDLIPPEVTLELARVLTFGANKYGDNNWKNCPDKGRYIAATQRHILAYQIGTPRDEESNLYHLALS